MPTSVRVPNILHSYTDGQKVVQANGATLAELLADLDARYPGIRARIVSESGTIHRFVNVYINDEDVRFLEPAGLAAAVRDGDTVAILPAVAGG